MKAAKKVFYNTGFLYGKVVVTMFIALFSTRLILKSLGTEDFGIFNLLAGVILMLSFLNGAMTVTTQRYLSFFLGNGQVEKNKEVFKTSITLHLFIGLLVVALLEITGLFLFDGWLNIPVSRIETAKYVFHFMVISTFFTINAVPYDAAINANEDLLFDSISGILEAVLKLGIAYYLLYTHFDKLITYGILVAAVTILIRLIKTVWCSVKYAECKFSFGFSANYTLLKEMASYAGWNLFGALCYVASSQGLSIILNRFYGAKINASYAVANQVNSQMQSFSVMMVRAFNPQIVKSEGGGDRERMIRLATQSSKFSVFLLLFMVIPMLIEMPFILKFWLSNVPQYTAAFCMIVLVTSVVSQMSTGLKTAVQATGKIKLYQSVVGSTVLLTLPLSYFLLKSGYPAYSVLIGGLCLEAISLVIRLRIVHSLTGLSINAFFKNIILKVVVISAVGIGISLLPGLFISEGFIRLGVVLLLSFCSTSSLIWNYGFLPAERDMVAGIAKGLTKKLSGIQVKFAGK
jgi:O-antigen/teichoic acid export membrane protein